ncbi:DgyrCDS6357 [Dimorphilus gyrociliatus]|nr:DgyrCDS6357 [Dimorphilus gyrociliatus]
MMFTPMLSISSSIFTMTAMSFERVLAIIKNVHLREIHHKVIIISIVWALSVISAGPQIYEYSTYLKFEEEENKTEISCGSHGIEENFETIYASILVFVGYVLPLVIISCNYGLIIRFLWNFSKSEGRDGPGSEVKGAVFKARVRVAKMIFTATALFAILWLPFFVFFTMEEVTGTDDSSEIGSTLQTLKQALIVISTFSNPIVYACYQKKFRSGIISLLSGKTFRGQRVEDTSTMSTAVS